MNTFGKGNLFKFEFYKLLQTIIIVIDWTNNVKLNNIHEVPREDGLIIVISSR